MKKDKMIVWANVTKKGTPEKLYVGDRVELFASIDKTKLEEVQRDSKYIFYHLSLE